MRTKILCTLILGACFAIPSVSKDEKPKLSLAVSWGYASHGPIEIKPSVKNRSTPTLQLGRGALLPVLNANSGKDGSTTRVGAVDPAKLEPLVGTVESSQIENFPLDQFPSDKELLKMMGGVYLDDFTASNTRIARYLVRQVKQDPALLCFIGAVNLPLTRLQVFQSSHGKYVSGPYLEFPASEMKSAITSLSIRDLLGDGNECIVTEEPFGSEPEYEGVNTVIRRMEGGLLRTLWKAPIQFRNLASFSSQEKILEPPETNIGANGTVTTATVEYRAHGSLTEPVWKGKVEFYVPDRKDPMDVVKIEKLCPWDGLRFAPIH